MKHRKDCIAVVAMLYYNMIPSYLAFNFEIRIIVFQGDSAGISKPLQQQMYVYIGDKDINSGDKATSKVG